MERLSELRWVAVHVFTLTSTSTAPRWVASPNLPPPKPPSQTHTNTAGPVDPARWKMDEVSRVRVWKNCLEREIDYYGRYEPPLPQKHLALTS